MLLKHVRQRYMCKEQPYTCTALHSLVLGIGAFGHWRENKHLSIIWLPNKRCFVSQMQKTFVAIKMETKNATVRALWASRRRSWTGVRQGSSDARRAPRCATESFGTLLRGWIRRISQRSTRQQSIGPRVACARQTHGMIQSKINAFCDMIASLKRLLRRLASPE